MNNSAKTNGDKGGLLLVSLTSNILSKIL